MSHISGFENWLLHADHLAGGVGYVRGCGVCELSASKSMSYGDTRLKSDSSWYERAQRSGRRAIDLDDNP